MKQLKALIVLITLFSTGVAVARLTDDAVDVKVVGKEIILTAKNGFHFNAEAPASVTFENTQAFFQPKMKTEPKLVFDLVSPSKMAKLNYYVCDDAKTVCEQHRKEVALDKFGDVKKSFGKMTNPPPGKVPPVASFESDRPTLLIFSAPWCPACIRMKTETYTQTPVKALFKKMNQQTINVDLVENEALSKQFGVKAIPTLVLLNKEGQEVYRWLDYQPATQFAASLKKELNNSVSLAKLQERAELGDIVAAEKLALVSFNQMRWEDASRWYALTKGEKNQNMKLGADVNVATDAKDADEKMMPEYLKALEKGFTLSTSKYDQARWKLDYLEQKMEQKKSIEPSAAQELKKQLLELKDSKAIAKAFVGNTYGDMSAFEKAETLDMLMRTSDLLNDEVGKKEFKTELAKHLAMRSDYSEKTPGKTINMIYYFTQAGSLDAAEAWGKKLIAKYPETYVYYDRYARFLLKQKRYPEALAQIELALKYKEGNEPQLNVTKVKILTALDKKEDALKVVDDTLALIEPHPEKYKRTKNTLAGLKEELTKK